MNILLPPDDALGCFGAFICYFSISSCLYPPFSSSCLRTLLVLQELTWLLSSHRKSNDSARGVVQTDLLVFESFFLLWQTYHYSAIHQPAPCVTESIPHAAAPSCPLSARFSDWSVALPGCQTPYPGLHHSERAELPGVPQENLAGELLSPCCPRPPHAISSPFSGCEVRPKERQRYPSNSRGFRAEITLIKERVCQTCAEWVGCRLSSLVGNRRLVSEN